MTSTTIKAAATAARRPSGLLIPIVVIGVGVAAIALAKDPAYGWAGVLVGAVFGITIAIGGALFASINVASGARWWGPVRHLCIGTARTIWIPIVALALVLAFGIGSVYPWAQEHVLETNHLVHSKTGWLNEPFFIARSVVIMLVWLVFIGALRKRIANQQARGLVPTAVLFLVVFALTISVGFWDWTMSIEPTWFSTMHGVYGFAGALQVGIAVVTIRAVRDRSVGAKPRYDLGSLLFAFSCFWGYIWYSQGMLIWYAHIPEETQHFAHRLSGGWTMLFWLNPLLNLAVPLIGLMSRHAKRSPLVVGQVAIIVVIGHFLDILLLVGPGVGPADSVLPWAAAGAAAAVGAGMILLQRRQAAV